MREGSAIKIIDSLLATQLLELAMRLGSEQQAKAHMGKFSHIQGALAALREGRGDGYIITASLSIWIDELKPS